MIHEYNHIAEKVKEHDTKIIEHDKRISTLEVDGREYKVQIENLIKNVADLVVTLKWFMATLLGGLAGFFFYAIEQNLFK